MSDNELVYCPFFKNNKNKTHPLNMLSELDMLFLKGLSMLLDSRQKVYFMFCLKGVFLKISSGVKSLALHSQSAMTRYGPSISSDIRESAISVKM